MITNKPLMLKSIALLSVVSTMILSCGKQVSTVSETNPWKKMDLIINSIPETKFLKITI